MVAVVGRAEALSGTGPIAAIRLRRWQRRPLPQSGHSPGPPEVKQIGGNPPTWIKNSQLAPGLAFRFGQPSRPPVRMPVTSKFMGPKKSAHAR